MQHFADTVTDEYGNAREGMRVLFTTQAGVPVTLYSDDEGSQTPNPLRADSLGEISCYLPSGRYLRSAGSTAPDLIQIGDYFKASGSGAIARPVTEKLAEMPPSRGDYSGSTPATVPGCWYWDYTNPDGAGQQQLKISVPSTVSMTGGGGVQGVGLIFSGSTSAQTPNSGLAETNMIRMAYAVNSDAGSKVQVHLINGLLTVANDEAGTGNESAFILGTARSTGPTVGTAAVGVWGADFHVEKSAGVLDGSMVALEVGVHKAPALGAAKCIGVDIWSGDRSGITASRAGDAVKISGGAGWTNFLKFLHTDSATNVLLMDRLGNTTITAPTGDLAVTAQTNANATTGTFTVSGRTGGGSSVNAIIQCQSGGQVSIGASTNQDLVLVQNNTEAMRLDASQQALFKGRFGYSASGTGNAIAQATDKSTAVTLNKPSGEITMNSAALAAGAKVSFQVNNSYVSANDIPTVCVKSGGTANAYRAAVTAVAAGSFTVTIENITGGSLSESPKIQFNLYAGSVA